MRQALLAQPRTCTPPGMAAVTSQRVLLHSTDFHDTLDRVPGDLLLGAIRTALLCYRSPEAWQSAAEVLSRSQRDTSRMQQAARTWKAS